MSNLQEKIFSCQCITTMYGEKTGNEELCIANFLNVAECARRFTPSHLSFLGRGSEREWNGNNTYKPNGEWDRVAEDMMLNFSESGHSYSVDPEFWNEEL